MGDGTAATTASIRFIIADTFDARRAPEMNTPAWLGRVRQRIARSSIGSQQPGSALDERWLSEDVANSAWTFFGRTADVLPGEPFIYSSHAGELVADFETARGTLSIIVSPQSAYIFASKAGESIPKQFELRDVEGIRKHLRALAGFFAGKGYASVDAGREKGR